MSNEATKLIKKLTSLGVPVRDTKSGWMIQAPDGSSIAVHRTESDHRAIKNTLSRLRKAGIQLDKETDMDIKARKETIEAVRNQLAQMGNPDLFSVSKVYKDLDMAPQTIFRSLTQMGYVKVGHGMWGTADTTVVEPRVEEAEPVLDAERINAIPTITIEIPKPAEREFIDSEDSFTIDPITVQYLTVAQLCDAMKALGNQFEIRVWK